MELILLAPLDEQSPLGGGLLPMQETWSTEPWSVRVARYQLHGGLIPLAYQMISDPAVKTREVLAMWMAHRPGIVYLYTKGVKEEIVAKSPDSVLCVDEAFIAKLIQSKIISKTDTSIDLIGSQHKRDGFVLYQAILKDASPGPLSSSNSGSMAGTSSSGPSASQSSSSGSVGSSNQATLTSNHPNHPNASNPNNPSASAHAQSGGAGGGAGGAGVVGGGAREISSATSSASSAASSLLFHLRVPYSNSASMLQLLHSGITTFPISTRDAAKMARDAQHLFPQHASLSSESSRMNGFQEGHARGDAQAAMASTSLLFPSSVPSSLYSSFSKPPHPSFIFTTPSSTLPATIPVVTPFASMETRQQANALHLNNASANNASSASNMGNVVGSAASNAAGSAVGATAVSSINAPSLSSASASSAGTPSGDSKMAVDNASGAVSSSHAQGVMGGGNVSSSASSSLLLPPSSAASLAGAPIAAGTPRGGAAGLGNAAMASSTLASTATPSGAVSSHGTPSMTPSGPLASMSSTPSASAVTGVGGVALSSISNLEPLPSLSAASLAPLIELPFLPPSEEDMKSILDHLPMYLANAKPIQFLPHSQKLLEFPTPATPTLPASPHPYLTTDTQILRRRDRKLDDELDRYTVIYYLQLIFPPKSLARN